MFANAELYWGKSPILNCLRDCKKIPYPFVDGKRRGFNPLVIKSSMSLCPWNTEAKAR